MCIGPPSSLHDDINMNSQYTVTPNTHRTYSIAVHKVMREIGSYSTNVWHSADTVLHSLDPVDVCSAMLKEQQQLQGHHQGTPTATPPAVHPLFFVHYTAATAQLYEHAHSNSPLASAVGTCPEFRKGCLANKSTSSRLIPCAHRSLIPHQASGRNGT